ncbi:MAG: hypothetical protein DMG53_17850 [Acidobacteria bacterium]|nr:MAG: hypothetical protein DMG53_17850 [Acidobacteriota bacterium]
MSPNNHWRLITALLIAWAALVLGTRSSRAWQASETAVVPLQVIVVSSAAEARLVRDRLKNGEDFAALAREKSIDPYADQGGYVGEVDPATLRIELREALKGLAPGQVSGIVELQNPPNTVIGYAILRILSKNESPSAGRQSMGVNRDLPLSAKGALRFPVDIAGQVIANLLFQKFPKPVGWSQDLSEICRIRKQSLSNMVDRLEKRLDPLHPEQLSGEKPFDVIQEHYALAQLHAYQGNMDQAIKQWEAAYRIAAEIPGGRPQLEEVLGTAHLHKAEIENGVYRTPGDRCLFPPRPGNPFPKYEISSDSIKAIQYFTKYLETKPEDLEVKWLLNLAYMTLGKYPAAVPQKYLIPPSAFESKEDIGRFSDVAVAAGLKLFSMAGGVIVDDLENNGLLDVVTSSYDVCESMHYFHNNGDGTFTDRTAEAGLAEPATSTQTAVWADIDNDGYLDLLVGNENGTSQLFHNKGDGTFEDISRAAGVDRKAFTKGVNAADYDNDGYVDFYVSNLYGGNFLYHNNHDRTFSEVSERAGVHQPQSQSFATWFFDYDNDGWPDLFVTSYYFSLDESLRSYLGRPHNAETLKLYRNLGNGTFRDVTKDVGLDKIFLPMGANFGDVDNDGFLDIYLGTGGPEYGAMAPNALLRNHAGKYFADITASSGTGELHKGHGIAFADLGNNGHEDILLNSGGATPGDAHAFRVFRNPGNNNDWITVRLAGVKTNRCAIGARIKITVENESHAIRSIYRIVGSGGSFGASPLQQHIGLGKAVRIVNLEVDWPASKTRQSFSNVPKNQIIEIKEFATAYRELPHRIFGLGPAKR